jgi:hypothetical protein
MVREIAKVDVYYREAIFVFSIFFVKEVFLEVNSRPILIEVEHHQLVVRQEIEQSGLHLLLSNSADFGNVDLLDIVSSEKTLFPLQLLQWVDCCILLR